MNSFQLRAKHGHVKNLNIMVVGPSGSGKSSFIEFFMKLYDFDAAKVQFDDEKLDTFTTPTDEKGQ